MYGLIEKAELYMRAAHTAVGQYRKKSRIQYHIHPNRVMRGMLLRPADFGVQRFDDNVLAAALLHDVIEDTEITDLDLRETFPNNVVDLVVELTDQFTKDAHPGTRAQRKALEHARLGQVSHEAKLIKLSDRLDNLQDNPFDEDATYKEMYLKETEELLAALNVDVPAVRIIKEVIHEYRKA